MNLKDGTPARIGDIVQNTAGVVGTVIGGTTSTDPTAATLSLVTIGSAFDTDGGQVFCGAFRDSSGVIIERGVAAFAHSSGILASDCSRIGHVDIGNG
jgi:hypothetical protein